MAGELHPSAQRVQDTLRRLGFANEVVQLPQSARSAGDAAAAIGCAVGQIVKSLVFKTVDGARGVVVLTSGANRVDEAALAALVGAPMARADAAFVREHTGYAIGGVAPVGHVVQNAVYIDRDLFQYAVIWAAAGHPNAVFRLTPDELVRMTGGTLAAVAEASRR